MRYRKLPIWLEKLTRIRDVVDDWVTPVEYLPYIDHLLGTIELDPCSTHRANEDFIRAKKIYTYADDGLNIEEPWKGTTYLFPPTFGKCSYSKKRGTWRWSKMGGGGTHSFSPAVAWFKRLEREWKLRNIPEALFFTTCHEMVRMYQGMWEYPVCIPSKRCCLIHGRTLQWVVANHRPMDWGFFVYLPKSEFGFNQADKFIETFSELGKVIY